MPLEQFLHQPSQLTYCEHHDNRKSHLEVLTGQVVAQTKDHVTYRPELSSVQLVTMWKTGHSSTYRKVYDDSERATPYSCDANFVSCISDGGTRPVTI